MTDRELAQRVRDRWAEGYCCAPVAFSLAVSPLTEPDRQTLRAMNGFCGGMGVGSVCGVLSGCLAAIGCWLGKGASDESRDSRLRDLCSQLVERFDAHFGAMDCGALMPIEPSLKANVCPGMAVWAVGETWKLLAESGVDPTRRPDGR